MQHPDKITEKVKKYAYMLLFFFKDIEDIITTVDRNQDGKISFSEFRVSAKKTRKNRPKGRFFENLS